MILDKLCTAAWNRHSVRALFLRRPGDVRRLLLAGSEEAHGEFVAAAAAAGIRPEVLEPQDFIRTGAFTRDEKHQGVLVLASPRRIYSERDFGRLAQARAVLALDQISNPQNLATMVRSAAFFGVAAVVLLRDRSADVSAEVVRYVEGDRGHHRLRKGTGGAPAREARAPSTISDGDETAAPR